ncbi:hypothetical protein CRYUN_Cryun03dG0094500 [Craigia yunnanensis]
MWANEFDGNAAFSGGGFMPSQATQTPPDRPSSSSKNSDARCLIPFTVKQLKDLSRGGESGISIDGVDVNNISLVGMVSKIDNAVSDCTFRVDDGTGWVECTKWIHEHVDSAEVDAISVGMYVRVYGQLKSIQSRRTVQTFSIRPVTDFNEIAYHFIECIYVHLYNTKLRGSMTTQPQLTNSIGGMTTQPQFSGQYNTDEKQILGVSSMILNYHGADKLDDECKKMSQRCEYKQALLSFTPVFSASETGVRSDVVARELNISLDKIRKTLEYLSSEGLVYTTTNDHYKFTDA